MRKFFPRYNLLIAENAVNQHTLFNNTEYMSAFQDFDFSQLSFPWNVFYLSASKKRANTVLFMGEAMEKARKIIFFKN